MKNYFIIFLLSSVYTMPFAKAGGTEMVVNEKSENISNRKVQRLHKKNTDIPNSVVRQVSSFETDDSINRLNFIKNSIIENEISILDPLYFNREEGLPTELGTTENNNRLQTFIREFDMDDADVNLVVVGSGGKADQEIPDYIKKLVSTDKKVSIFSIEPLYYIRDYIRNFPHSFLDENFYLEHKIENGISIWSGVRENLKFSAFSSFIPENENDTFYSDFEQSIRGKLNRGQIVLFGNHTTAHGPLDIPGIVKIFNNQFDNNQEKKFILYTQCAHSPYYLSVGKYKNHEDFKYTKNYKKESILSILNKDFNPLKFNMDPNRQPHHPTEFKD